MKCCSPAVGGPNIQPMAMVISMYPYVKVKCPDPVMTHPTSAAGPPIAVQKNPNTQAPRISPTSPVHVAITNVNPPVEKLEMLENKTSGADLGRKGSSGSRGARGPCPSWPIENNH